MGSAKGMKPFSLSTTLRSFTRVPDFMEILAEMERTNNNTYQVGSAKNIGSKLAKQKIVKRLIKNGFITSNNVDSEIQEKITLGKELSDKEVDTFMNQAQQAPGWDGRFSNYMNKIEPLGFAYRNADSGKIELTELGTRFNTNPIDSLIWSLSNIPSKSPMTRRENIFTPFGILALYLKKTKNSYISKSTLAALLSIHHYNEIDELIDSKKTYAEKYEQAMALTDVPLKIGTFKDYADEFSRTIVFTRMFTYGYDGVEATKSFLSNLDLFIHNQELVSKKFEKITTINEFIDYVNNQKTIFFDVEDELNNSEKIKNAASHFKTNEIKELISDVSNKRNVFIANIPNDMKAFVVIEWLTAMLLTKGENIYVSPNLKLDSEGYPISHAPGNAPDIEVSFNSQKYNVEVTLITTLKQMENNETTSIAFHAKETNSKVILIAPKLHERVIDYFKFTETTKNIEMAASTFENLINNYPENNFTKYFSIAKVN